MTADRVQLSIDGSIATVTLTRGDKHNGVDIPMLRAVIGAAADLASERGVRGVIVHGDGPSFCAGLDFKAVLGGPPVARAAAIAKLWSPIRNQFQDWSMAWRALPVPVVAAMHGACYGAGMQLALGCDFRIATPDAKLSLMEAKYGLVPDMGGIALLRELVRIDVAKELVMTGRIVSGADAHAIGIVTHVAADPVSRARALLDEIATRSPDSVGAAKLLVQEAWHADEPAALASERRWQRAIIGRENQRIAMKGQGGFARRKLG